MDLSATRLDLLHLQFYSPRECKTTRICAEEPLHRTQRQAEYPKVFSRQQSQTRQADYFQTKP